MLNPVRPRLQPSNTERRRNAKPAQTKENGMHPSISDRFQNSFQFFWSDGDATRPPIEEAAPRLFSMQHPTVDKALVLDFDQRHLASFNPKNMGRIPD